MGPNAEVWCHFQHIWAYFGRDMAQNAFLAHFFSKMAK
jgi:hypothetical protein